MLTAREIDMEISKRETGPSTMQTVEQLALLYIVRDHLYPTSPTAAPEPSNAPMPQITRGRTEYSGAHSGAPAGSEFVQIAMSVPEADLLEVLDEHMEAIKILYPKEYRAVMRKIENIK